MLSMLFKGSTTVPNQQYLAQAKWGKMTPVSLSWRNEIPTREDIELYALALNDDGYYIDEILIDDLIFPVDTLPWTLFTRTLRDHYQKVGYPTP